MVLHKDLILIKHSAHVECSNNVKKFSFPEHNEVLTIINNTIKLEEYNFAKIKISPRMKILDKFNYYHSRKVVDGINTIDDFLKLATMQDNEETVVIERDSMNKAKELEQTKQMSFRNSFLQILKILGTITTLLTIIGIIILTIIFRAFIFRILNCLFNMFNCNVKRGSTAVVKFSTGENIEIITNPNNDKTLASAPIKIDKSNEMELKPLIKQEEKSSQLGHTSKTDKILPTFDE